MLILSATKGNNLDLAHAFASQATVKGLSSEVIALPDLQMRMFDSTNKDQGAGEGLDKLEQALKRHSGLVVCAPEYNGSIPPILSNAMAWLSVSTADFRALFNTRPVVVATHSGGGGQKVLVAMRLQFAHLGCTVLGRELMTNPQKPANPESIAALVAQLNVLEASYEGVPASV